MDMTQEDLLKTPPKIGVLLRQKRLEKNISLETVASDLKLRPRLVTALEESDYKNLADATSVAALVKSYARYLGLNADQMASGYRHEIESIRKKVVIDFPEMLTSDFKISKIAIIASLFIIGAFFMWNFFKHSMLPEPDMSIAKFNALIKEGKKQELAKKEAPKEEPKKLAVRYEVIIPPLEEFDVVRATNISVQAARGDSWVEIRDGNRKIIFSGILRKGQDYSLPENEGGYFLKTGNAGVLDVYKNEENLHLFTSNMHVVKDVKL